MPSQALRGARCFAPKKCIRCSWSGSRPAPGRRTGRPGRPWRILVTALLVGQSLRPSAWMRALVSPRAGPARQRYRRVARAWTRPWLSPGWLTPRLVQAARTLVPGERRVALDSVRCGGWEVFTVGLLWHGRVLPVAGWRCRTRGPRASSRRACARCWAGCGGLAGTAPSPHLLADRAFPSQRLFATLQGWGWEWTVRLRARCTGPWPASGSRCGSGFGRAGRASGPPRPPPVGRAVARCRPRW